MHGGADAPTAVLTRRDALAAVVAVLVPAGGARAQPRPAKLVFVFSRAGADPYTRWLIRLYTEALGRLGIGFEFLEVPANRATAMSSAGEVDGELGRVREFAELYPSLVRVEEPNNVVLFSAFAMTALPGLASWDDLRRSDKAIGYRAGIKEIEAELDNAAYAGHATDVAQVAGGLMMLQRGRIDVYLDVQQVVSDYLASPAARADLEPGRWPVLVAALQRTTGHAYLHERHRALAPRLAAVLRAMKADGLHARYLAEALGGASAIPEGFFDALNGSSGGCGAGCPSIARSSSAGQDAASRHRPGSPRRHPAPRGVAPCASSSA